MTYVDGILLAIIVLSGLWGLYRGLVREILSLIVWAVAFYLGARFSTSLTFIHNAVQSPFVASALSFFLVFIIVLIVGMIIVIFISKAINKTPLSPFNRLLGAVFGIVRGLIVCSVVVWVGEATPWSSDLAWHNSVLVPYFLTVVLYVQQGITPMLNQYLEMHPLPSLPGA